MAAAIFLVAIGLLISLFKILLDNLRKQKVPDKVNNMIDAVKNHTHESLNSYINKHQTHTPKTHSLEDEIYEQVMLEIEENKKVRSTWGKALAKSDGDKDKAISCYILMRVKAIKLEIEKNSFVEQKNKLKIEKKSTKKQSTDFKLSRSDEEMLHYLDELNKKALRITQNQK